MVYVILKADLNQEEVIHLHKPHSPFLFFL